MRNQNPRPEPTEVDSPNIVLYSTELKNFSSPRHKDNMRINPE